MGGGLFRAILSKVVGSVFLIHIYVCVHTEVFKLLYLNVQVISQLTLFGEEISIVSVIEPHFILSQWPAE